MSAVSQAQRGYLAVHMGKAWMRRHHFDNKGPLPEHVSRAAKKASPRRKKRRRRTY